MSQYQSDVLNKVSKDVTTCLDILDTVFIKSNLNETEQQRFVDIMYDHLIPATKKGIDNLMWGTKATNTKQCNGQCIKISDYIIAFSLRSDVDYVLYKLKHRAKCFGSASVGYLNWLLGEPSMPMEEQYGWYSFEKHTYVSEDVNGYYNLRLPKIERFGAEDSKINERN